MVYVSIFRTAEEGLLRLPRQPAVVAGLPRHATPPQESLNFVLETADNEARECRGHCEGGGGMLGRMPFVPVEAGSAASRRGSGILPVQGWWHAIVCPRGPGVSRIPAQSPSQKCHWGQSSSR